MKKNNKNSSKIGAKRTEKNKARMKRNQQKYESLLEFLEHKVLPKYGNVWSKEQSDKAREKKD
jgi:hypothetical protein